MASGRELARWHAYSGQLLAGKEVRGEQIHGRGHWRFSASYSGGFFFHEIATRTLAGRMNVLYFRLI